MVEVAEYRTNYQSGARDVQFNPKNPETFASAYEQNSIEVGRQRRRVSMTTLSVADRPPQPPTRAPGTPALTRATSPRSGTRARPQAGGRASSSARTRTRSTPSTGTPMATISPPAHATARSRSVAGKRPTTDRKVLTRHAGRLGGRSRVAAWRAQVWDVRMDMKQAVVTIQTITSVIQVQWRPGHPWQLVSAANQMDK